MVGKKKKLIVFRLDASYQRGLGHLYRMVTLAVEFKKKGFDCLFVLRANEVASKILGDRKFKYLLYPDSLAEEELIEGYFKDWTKPALWIFDILSTDKTLVVYTKSKGVPVVSFDDLNGGLFCADLVINAIVGCWEEDSEKSVQNFHVLKGPQYSIIDPKISSLVKKRKLLKEKIRVGVTMGGSDTHGATVEIAKVLSKMKDLYIEVTFFLGPHFSHDEELGQIVLSLPHYSLRKTIKNLHVELFEMDVVFCGGGQTLFELCSMGMPIMALANEDHEEKTIKYFERHGACISIGSTRRGINPNSIYNFLKVIKSDHNKLNQMMQNAVNLVDGKGTERCLKACTTLIK